MLVGYELLSKNYNLFDREKSNIEAIKKLQLAGCERIYVDFAEHEQNQLKEAFKLLNKGDTLVVSRISKLGYSNLTLLQNLNLIREKGIFLRSLEEFYLIPSSSTNIKRLIENLFSLEEKLSKFSVSEIETESKMGRPETMTDEKCQMVGILKACCQEISVSQICKIIGVCRQTYYNAKRKGKLDKYLFKSK